MHIILDAFIHTLTQFSALFGILLIGGLGLTLISRYTSRVFQQFVYPKLGLYLFGVVGVPFHELSHAIFCKLFGHEIQDIKWFDPKGKGGAYGAVTHAYNETNLYHRTGHFFIGLGPTILAPVALASLYSWLVPGARSFDLFHATDVLWVLRSFSSSLFVKANFTSWGFYFFLYLAISISSQVELSAEDLGQVKTGIIPILVCLLIFNLIVSSLGLHWHPYLIQWGWRFSTLCACLFTFASTLALANLAICSIIFRPK